MWLLFAVLSAVCAAAVSILAKVGIRGMDSNLATAVRTIVVLAMAWGVVFITGAQKGLTNITRANLIFLAVSGVATGLSWLFYFKALQFGNVSKVAPIDKFSLVITIIMSAVFLREAVSVKAVIGVALITAGTLLMIL